MEAKKTFIYLLFDPRPEERRCYVGKTVLDLRKRLAGHMAFARKKLNGVFLQTWLLDLMSNNMEPEVLILEEVYGEEWEEKEKYWISYFRENSSSFDLLNAGVGGNGGPEWGYDRAEHMRRIMTGRAKHSEEARRKMSESRKGVPLREDVRRKVSVTVSRLWKEDPSTFGQKGPRSEDVKQKIREGALRYYARKREEIGSNVTEKEREDRRLRCLGRKLSPESIEKGRLKRIGRKVSDETREKLRVSHLGQKPSLLALERARASAIGRVPTEETRQKIGLAHAGKKLSEETKEKIRFALLGSKRPPEVGEKIGRANRGRAHTEEAKSKMRLAKAGFKPSMEAIEKRKKTMIEKRLRGELTSHWAGKHHTEETKEKLRRIKIGKRLTEETKEKISVALTGRQTSEETKEKLRLVQKRLWARKLEVSCE